MAWCVAARTLACPSARGGALAATLLLALASCGQKTGGLETCSPTPHYAQGIVHGPHVSLPAPTSVTITWVSKESGRGTVEYGPTPAYGLSAADRGGAAPDHHVAVTGLAPATAYHYRILVDGVAQGADRSFRTAPPLGSEGRVRIAVVGDTGTGCAEEAKVLGVVEGLDPDFVIDTGDVGYKEGDAENVYDGFLVPFAALAERVAVFPTLGNHDVKTGGGIPLLHVLDLPVNSTRGTKDFYSLDWGNVHVVCLNSNIEWSPQPIQTRWLAEDLSASRATWKVVFFHHPAYSSSRHGSTAYVDADWVPVFDAQHVDLVLNGHDHDYERTHPMAGGKPADTSGGPEYADPKGTIYVVTGGGGADLYVAGRSPFTAVSASVHNAVVLEVAGKTLEVRAVNDEGAAFDRAKVTKTR